MPSDGAVAPALVAEAALTDAELDAVHRRAVARTSALVPTPIGWRELVVGLVLAVAGALLALLLDATTERGGPVVALLLLIAYAAGLYAMIWIMTRRQRAVVVAQRRSTPFLYERRRYRLGKDGIQMNADTAESLWSWRALTEVEEVGGLLLFWAGHAWTFGIPVRGFASPEVAAAALAYARARIAAAHPDQSSTRASMRP